MPVYLKKMGNIGVKGLVVWVLLSIGWQISFTVFKPEDLTLHYVIIIMTFCLAFLLSQALESNVKY